MDSALSLSNKILASLELKDGLNSLALAEDLNEDHQKVIGTIKSLQSLGNVIKTEQKTQVKLELTPEGNKTKIFHFVSLCKLNQVEKFFILTQSV